MKVLYRLFIAILMAVVALPGLADDTGWVLCASGADGGSGDKAWTNPNNVASGTTAEASAIDLLGQYDVVNRLHVLWDDFGIGATATLDGIEVRVRARANNSNDMALEAAYLVIGGTRTARNFSYGTSRLDSAIKNYDQGGPANTGSGGTAPTIAEINSGTFGLSIDFLDDGSGSGDDVWVEAVWMKITYTPGPGGAPSAANFFPFMK